MGAICPVAEPGLRGARGPRLPRRPRKGLEVVFACLAERLVLSRVAPVGEEAAEGWTTGLEPATASTTSWSTTNCATSTACAPQSSGQAGRSLSQCRDVDWQGSLRRFSASHGVSARAIAIRRSTERTRLVSKQRCRPGREPKEPGLLTATVFRSRRPVAALCLVGDPHRNLCFGGGAGLARGPGAGTGAAYQRER